MYMYTSRGHFGGLEITALDEAILVHSVLSEHVAFTQLVHVEVWPAGRRLVARVHVDRNTRLVGDTEVQTLLDALGVLVLRRPG